MAKALSPHGLTLATAQRNLAVRRFYEKHGFQVVKEGRGGIIRQQCVECCWQPEAW